MAKEKQTINAYKLHAAQFCCSLQAIYETIECAQYYAKLSLILFYVYAVINCFSLVTLNFHMQQRVKKFFTKCMFMIYIFEDFTLKKKEIVSLQILDVKT